MYQTLCRTFVHETQVERASKNERTDIFIPQLPKFIIYSASISIRENPEKENMQLSIEEPNIFGFTKGGFFIFIKAALSKVVQTL